MSEFEQPAWTPKKIEVDVEEQNPPTFLSVMDAPKTVVATADAPAAPVERTAGTAPTAGRDPQQFLTEIAIQKQDLARLYDSNTGRLIETMPDGKPAMYRVEGEQLTPAQYRDLVVTKISTLYEGAIDAAKGNKVPGNDARVVTGRQTAEAIEQELKTKYGIELPKGVGGRLTSYTVEQTAEATNNPEAKALLVKLNDTIRGVVSATVNQNAPDRYTMEYATFLRGIGMTSQADRLLTAMEPNTVARYSNQYDALSKQIVEDFATARGKLVSAENDPLATLEEARKRLAAGDNAGAEAAFAKAYKQYDALPQDKMTAEVKRLVDAQAAVTKQQEEMQKAGLMTPAKQAAFEMQKNQLLVMQANWEQLQAAKGTIQLEHAHYLVTGSPTKDTPETRHRAQEMLDEVRYTDRGKLALMMDMARGGEARFTDDLQRAGQGAMQAAPALQKFGENMGSAASAYQESNQLREQAKKIRDEAGMFDWSMKDEATRLEALAETRLKQARMYAENARNDAAHIDPTEAKFQQTQAKANLQRLVEAETAKPAGERNEAKLAFLQNMQKPRTEQDPANRALLDNLLNPPEKVDKAKLAQLRQIMGDDYSTMEVAQLHATMADAEMRLTAGNQARMVMLQIDVESGKGENNPLTAEIEANDPDGSFRATLPWDKVKEATRDIGMWESIWNGVKDVGIGLVSGLVAVGAFVAVTAGSLGWGAPAGVAVGLAAGTATYMALKGLSGEKVTLWTAGEGLVNSAASLATMGMGGAIAGQLGKSAIARGFTVFGAGMTGNMTYHAGMETIHWQQGMHKDFTTAMLSAGSQSLADAPNVAITAAIFGPAGARIMKGKPLDLSPSVTRQVLNQWTNVTTAYEPSVMSGRAKDVRLSRIFDERGTLAPSK